jgi:hypothetical protein
VRRTPAKYLAAIFAAKPATTVCSACRDPQSEHHADKGIDDGLRWYRILRIECHTLTYRQKSEFHPKGNPGHSRGKETGRKQQKEQRQIHDGVARQKLRSENKQDRAKRQESKSREGPSEKLADHRCRRVEKMIFPERPITTPRLERWLAQVDGSISGKRSKSGRLSRLLSRPSARTNDRG